MCCIVRVGKRIYVECAFGEIDRRWGIFWKPLEGSLKGHQYTIDSALRLHNFIVNYRERELHGEEDEDVEELNQASDTFHRRNPFVLMGTYSEGRVTSTVQSRGRTMGRPRAELIAEGNHGKALRNRLRDNLRAAKLTRPKGKKYGKRDRFNRV